MDKGHNHEKAANNEMQAEWYRMCAFPKSTIQPDGVWTPSSSEPYINVIGVDTSSGAGLVKRKSNDRVFALAKYIQCGSSVVHFGGCKLDTDVTTSQSNDELERLLYKDLRSCNNRVISLR